MFLFIEHPGFTKQITELFSDEDYRRFQADLVSNPIVGNVIPGLGGVRKVRWGAKGKGKRGGARVIYLYIAKQRVIYLFYVYTKGSVLDMNPTQRKRLAQAVETIKQKFT